MKKYTGGFRLPIRRKLFLFFLFAIIIPLLLFGSFLFSQQVRVLEDEIEEAAQRELAQMAERLNLEFMQVQAVSNLFYLDEEIALLLQNAGQHLPEEQAAQQLAQRISHYNTGLNNIRFKAAIVTPDGKIWGDIPGTVQQEALQLEAMPWYTQLQKRTSDIIWVADDALNRVFSSPQYPYICLVRQLHNRQTWEPIGTLVLGIAELDILKMYSGYVGWDQSCYIVDSEDTLVSSVENFSNFTSSGLLPEDYANFAGSLITGKGNNRLLVNYYTISSTQWKVITCSDLGARLGTFAGVINVYFIILALYLVITVLLSGFMARQFTKPITNLYSSIRKVKEGDLTVEVPVTTKDEVGEVAGQFNGMLAEIRELMDNVVQEQKLKRDAEILSLQTQINPHFLYNTLASIRFLVYTGNKKTADDAILSLIRLMKNTLSDAREFVTVENEFDLLSDYIQLQKLAFDRPVDVKVDVEEEILACKTIKLLLQPVVENAFLHGLKPKRGDVGLAISGRANNGDLVFVVEDNGVGFDTSKACYTDKNPHSRSVGLSNVHSRIVLTFGEEYGLDVRSKPGEGTTVTLRIPQIHSKGEYSSYEHFSGG